MTLDGPKPARRIQSVDALRGAIMMLMAIDHIRDYMARSAQQFLPTDLTRTTPAIFAYPLDHAFLRAGFHAHSRPRRIFLDDPQAPLETRAVPAAD
jgi:hypothetical protein